MKRTYFVALVIALGVAAWMLSGLLITHTVSEDKKDAEFKTLLRTEIAKVQIQHLVAKPQQLTITLRGHTQAKRVVAIKAEMGGRVVAVPVEKGQRVKQGDLLCQLAEDDHVAQLEQARAMLDKTRIDYEGAQRLSDKHLLSPTMVAASKAALENAKAGVKSAEVAVQRLSLRAPFAGFVEDRPAQIGDLIERSGICAQLVDESVVLATGQASEKEIMSLHTGQPITVQITNDGSVNGTLTFVGRAANPQTRTYRVEATLDADGTVVRDGTTAQLVIPLQEVMAYRISPALLSLDDAGLVGVRIVNAAHVVEFHRVHVVKENADGVWVSGLPPVIDLITVGQDFVANGDKVDTMLDTMTNDKKTLSSDATVTP